MGDASFVQSNFHGGEFSPFFQGRMDLPTYRTGMNVCRNSLPIEEGACVRRPGSRFSATTRKGNPGRLIAFDFQENAPYNMEFTDGYLRMFSGASGKTDLVLTNDAQPVTNISAANPAVVTTGAPHGWATGNQVLFTFDGTVPATIIATLQNRQFIITVTDTTDFSLADAITGAGIDGSAINYSFFAGISIARVLEIPTPYINGMWATDQLRSVQAEEQAILLQASVAPWVLDVATQPATGVDATFTLSPSQFLDGPYLDPVANSIATPTGTSGTILLTFSYAAWSSTQLYRYGDRVTYSSVDYQCIALLGSTGDVPSTVFTSWKALPNGTMASPVGFQSTDAGRLIRILSEPLPYNSGTAYVVGNAVSWNGAYYSCVANATGKQPDLYPGDWVISTAVATWTWGVITSVPQAGQANVALQGPNLLYTTTIFTYRLGVFSNTTGWPTCGCYHEGRLWLSGAVGNRIDSSSLAHTGGIFNFAPTEPDGTVTDANGISETFAATDVNKIFWMHSGSQGIICGTQAGEWLVQATTLNEPLTPTSIQAHRVTKYGCANVEPRETGLTLCFVQRYQRKLLEYFPDVFSGKFSAPNLSLSGKHLTAAGIQEIAYQRELAPVVWCRIGDGSLIGTTYKRETLFSSQGPTFNGWHRHDLGSGRLVESICVGPSTTGDLDTLAMITNDPATGIRHVETLTDIFDEDTPITAQSFVDDSVCPSSHGAHGAYLSGSNMTFTGLWHLNGKTVAVVIGGFDRGDFLVSGGQVTVTLGTGPQDVFTQAYLAQLTSSGVDFGELSTVVDVEVNGSMPASPVQYTIPVVIGYAYTSQGQLLRPANPQEAGAQNGPAFGKVSRQHQIAVLIQNGIGGTNIKTGVPVGFSFGTDFTKMHAALFKTKGGTNYTPTQLFSGVHWAMLDDTYGFDSMLAWQISRPCPGTVCAISGFINTQDR